MIMGFIVLPLPLSESAIFKLSKILMFSQLDVSRTRQGFEIPPLNFSGSPGHSPRPAAFSDLSVMPQVSSLLRVAALTIPGEAVSEQAPLVDE
jgi:hypothetical protein